MIHEEGTARRSPLTQLLTLWSNLFRHGFPIFSVCKKKADGDSLTCEIPIHEYKPGVNKVISHCMWSLEALIQIE